MCWCFTTFVALLHSMEIFHLAKSRLSSVELIRARSFVLVPLVPGPESNMGHESPVLTMKRSAAGLGKGGISLDTYIKGVSGCLSIATSFCISLFKVSTSTLYSSLFTRPTLQDSQQNTMSAASTTPHTSEHDDPSENKTDAQLGITPQLKAQSEETMRYVREHGTQYKTPQTYTVVAPDGTET
jgi:hypothetical protein